MMDSREQDARLVKRVLRGDDAALKELYEHHIPAVFQFVVRMSPADIDPDDVVQEAFVKAWKHLRRFNPKQSFRTWLFTIAKRTLLDHIKKKRPLLFSDFEAGDESDPIEFEVVDERPDPLGEALSRESDERVEAVLSELKPPQREVVVLHVLEGLTFREIGEMLKQPLDTVKTRYRRALTALLARFRGKKDDISAL